MRRRPILIAAALLLGLLGLGVWFLAGGEASPATQRDALASEDGAMRSAPATTVGKLASDRVEVATSEFLAGEHPKHWLQLLLPGGRQTLGGALVALPDGSLLRSDEDGRVAWPPSLPTDRGTVIALSADGQHGGSLGLAASLWESTGRAPFEVPPAGSLRLLGRTDSGHSAASLRLAIQRTTYAGVWSGTLVPFLTAYLNERGVAARWEKSGWANKFEVPLGDDGSVRIPLPSGGTFIVNTADSRALGRPGRWEVTVPTGGHEELELSLRWVASVRGTLKEGGRPEMLLTWVFLAGGEKAAWDRRRLPAQEWTSGLIDPGLVQFSVVGESAYMSRVPLEKDFRWCTSLQRIELAPGEHREGLELRMEAAPSLILEIPDGHGTPKVRLHPEDLPLVVRRSESVTEGWARYRVGLPSDGPHAVMLALPGHREELAGPVSIALGGERVLRVTPGRGLRVRGLLRDASGNAVVGAVVRLQDSGGRWHQVESDAQGGVVCEGLTAGFVTLHAQGPKVDGERRLRGEARFVVGGDHVEEVMMLPHTRVHGHVSVSSYTQSGLFVVAYPSTGHLELGRARTRADGFYELWLREPMPVRLEIMGAASLPEPKMVHLSPEVPAVQVDLKASPRR